MRHFDSVPLRCVFLSMLMAMMCVGLSEVAGALSPGDIAIIGYRCDDINGTANDGNDDAFAWLPLIDLPAGHVIYFTDDGWTAAGDFRGMEGGIKYTVPAGGLTAGKVMLLEYSRNTSSPGTHTFLPDPNLGTYESYNDAEVGTLGFETSTAGDNIFVFDGTTASPNFIYGVKTEDGSWDSDSTSNDSSALPAALTNGLAAVAFGGAGNANFDNGRYTGTTSGTRSQLLTQISDPANWSTSETDNFGGDITNGTGSSGGGADFTVVMEKESLTINLSQDWNSVSCPGDPVESDWSTVIAGNPNIALIVEYDTTQKKFVMASNIVFGKSYFIGATNNTQITLEYYPRESLSVPAKGGWNSLGSISCSIPAGNVTSDPSGQVSLIVYLDTNTGQFAMATTIEPGVGYMAGCLGDCTLSMNCTSPAPPIQRFVSKPTWESILSIQTQSEHKELVFGMNRCASNEIDLYDRPTPPMLEMGDMNAGWVIDNSCFDLFDRSYEGVKKWSDVCIKSIGGT